MGWTSGSLGKFEPVENIKKKLTGFNYTRDERDFKVKSMVQLHPMELNLDNQTSILSGIVIDEFVSKTRCLIPNEEGRYEIRDNKPSVDVQWGHFWLTTGGIVIAESKDARRFIFRVISQALVSNEEYIHPISIDIGRIGEDYPGHWLGSVIDRRGHWQSGTLFGDGLEDDDVVGEEYTRSNKNQIGIRTDYFGAPVKVKITRGGIVVVYSDLNREMDRFIRFIKDELLDYVV